MSRPLHVIAAEIHRLWPNPYYGATPYLSAMFHLSAITDKYFEDSAESVVLYFLSNASKWRSEDAKRIKLELKGMLPKR
jgi:hypothetical protein